jgi:hypothetical protein
MKVGRGPGTFLCFPSNCPKKWRLVASLAMGFPVVLDPFRNALLDFDQQHCRAERLRRDLNRLGLIWV